MIEHKDGCPSGDFGPCDCNVSLAQDAAARPEAEYVKAMCKELRNPGAAFSSNGKAADLIETLYLASLGSLTPAACERQWCTACGTVSSDGKCDCNRYEDREPHFVNYADSLQADVEAMAEDLVLLRAQVESMRASLNLAYVELKKHEADYHHRTSVAANNAIVDALGQSHTSTNRTPEREYEPGMNPSDDAEFGMKP